MKSPIAVAFAAAVLSFQLPQAAAGEVFRAAVYDDATRSVLARAGGQVTAHAPGARLVVKAGADEQIRVQALGSAGEVLSERLLRTDELGIASAPVSALAGEAPGHAIRIEQTASGRALAIGLRAGHLAAR